MRRRSANFQILTMRLAFYTYSYTDRLNMAIPECLERIAARGYSGIDISGTHGKSDDPKSFDADRRRLTRRTAERLGLRVEAVVTHATLTSTLFDSKRKPLDLKRTIDLAVDVGAEVVTFHMGGYRENVPRRRVWRQSVEAIQGAADYGARRHVELAVDGIWFDWIVDSPDKLARLFDDVQAPNFGVNFDPCYLTLMGIDPVGFAGRFREGLVHAHLKDHQLQAGRGEGGRRYPEWEHRMPGMGELDYVAVLKGLAGSGFQRAAAVECFTSMDFNEACDECYAAMTAAAGKAGVNFAS